MPRQAHTNFFNRETIADGRRPTRTHTNLLAARPAAANAFTRQALVGQKQSIASRLDKIKRLFNLNVLTTPIGFGGLINLYIAFELDIIRFFIPRQRDDTPFNRAGLPRHSFSDGWSRDYFY
jgi:hypothetical protein